MLLAFGVVMALLFWYEWSRIRRHDGDRGEKAAFAVLMVLAWVVGTLDILEVPLPNPTEMVQTLFDPFVLPR